jgi:hypothetical protein
MSSWFTCLSAHISGVALDMVITLDRPHWNAVNCAWKIRWCWLSAVDVDAQHRGSADLLWIQADIDDLYGGLMQKLRDKLLARPPRS